jgi:hypothetical protein
MEWRNLGALGKAGWAWLRPWASDASSSQTGGKLDGALWAAARDGNLSLASRLLSAGGDPKARGWRGRDALTAALSELRSDAGDFVALLAPRCDLGQRDEDGRSALCASIGSSASQRTMPFVDGVEAAWTIGFWTLLPMVESSRSDVLAEALIQAANVGWLRGMESIGDRMDWN